MKQKDGGYKLDDRPTIAKTQKDLIRLLLKKAREIRRSHNGG